MRKQLASSHLLGRFILMMGVVVTLVIAFIPAQAQGSSGNCAVTSYHLNGQLGGKSSSQLITVADPDRLLVPLQTHGGLAGGAGETAANLTEAQAIDQAAGGGVSIADMEAERIMTPALSGSFSAAPASTWVENVSSSITSGPEPVVILIVDDFQNPTRLESHGEFVKEIAEAAVERLTATNTIAPNTVFLEEVDVAYYTPGLSNTGHYRTDQIASEISERVDKANYSDPVIQAKVRQSGNFQRFVLNMSFNLIPCSDPNLKLDFFSFLSEHYADHTLSLQSQLGGAENLMKALYSSQLDSLDDLHELIKTEIARNSPGGFMFVPIGSAGNYSQNNAFYPAAWPEVLAVGASEGGDTTTVGKWIKSNQGDVLAPGAWFLFKDGVYRAGTSFSAPMVSSLVAAMLTRENITCDFAPPATRSSNTRFDNAVTGFCGP